LGSDDVRTAFWTIERREREAHGTPSYKPHQ
jgi:hypothetical protein